MPLIFHDLRGYDSHLIIKEAWRLVRGDIDAIPNSNEKLLSFKLENCVVSTAINFWDVA